MKTFCSICGFLASSLLVGQVTAHASPAGLAACAAITDAGQRLACYDQLAAAQQAPAAASTATVAPEAVAPAPALPAPAVPSGGQSPSRLSYLDRHWELSDSAKRGSLQFRPHETNYLIANYSTSPNNGPYAPFRSLAGGGNLSHFELSYQLGFKMKLLEQVAGSTTDLWVAYTQKSFWQASNEGASSPFRETNYTPEVMAVTPLDFHLLGFHGRFVNLGLVHQSNGQGSLLSRSWNRAYVQLGLERGDLSILARAWQRLGESAATDDNPDITRYLGHGDLRLMWRRNGHEVGLLTRYNPGTGRGAAQLSWGFPIAGKLLGYVQLFSGYGLSLIDYNHRQQTLGLGFQVNY